MKQLNKIWLRYAELSSCFMLAFGISVLLNAYMSLDGSNVITVTGIIITLCFIELWKQYKRLRIIHLSIRLIMILAVVLILRFNSDIWQLTQNCITWILSKNRTELHNQVFYRYCVVLIITVSASILSYISFCMGKCQCLTSIAVVMLCSAGVVYNWHIPGSSMICLGTYECSQIAQLIYRTVNKNQSRVKVQKAGIYLMPIFFCIVATVAALPYKDTPLQWEKIQQGYMNVKYKIEKLGYAVNLDFGGTKEKNCFENEKTHELGGNISLKDEPMMQVTLNYRPKEPTYLAKSYKESYLINRWEVARTPKSQIDEYRLDTYELLGGLFRQQLTRKLRSVIKTNKIKVTYNQLITKSLYMPPKVRQVEAFKQPVHYDNSGMTFEAVAGNGSKYDVSFIEWNTQNKLVLQMLCESDDFSYKKEGRFTLGELKSKIENELKMQHDIVEKENQIDLNALLAERADIIKERYTQLPLEFSERVMALSREITKDCHNNYERLMALKDYLRHYQYTLMPGELPKGAELTDYFLFEGKKGYCTYFATAMVMMGRSIGIPMRYVEGVIVDYEKTDKQYVYCVKSNKAHAWAEAYFEGYGWVIIEATPQYQLTGQPKALNTSLQQATCSKAVSKDMPEIQKLLKNEVHSQKQQSQERAEQKKAMHLVGLILTVLLLTGILLGGAIDLKYRIYYKKGDNTLRFKLLFYEMLHHLTQLGITFKENETLLQLEKKYRVTHWLNGMKCAH